jgi:putative membrane protein
LKIKKIHIASLLLLIFYTVGVFGILMPEVFEDFLSYTPFNLILTTVLLIWANGNFSIKLIVLFASVFLIGFGVEVLGVKSGVLFGSYQYGETLGMKLFEVPLTIGLNWFILAFSTAAIGSSIFKNKLLRALFAASLMTGLDVFIEPVAVQLDFWSWDGGEIPFQNFAMWFIVAFAIQLVVNFLKPKLEPKIAYVVFGVQVVFFLILNLFLAGS